MSEEAGKKPGEEEEYIELPEDDVTSFGDDGKPDPTPDDEAIQAEARLNGWVPKEEWRGDPEDWRPADEFVRRGREINPILRRNNERLMAEIQKRDQEMSEMRQTFEEFKQFSEESRKQALERQRRELMDRKKEAYENDDFETVTQLDEDLRNLDTASKPATSAPEPKPTDEPKPDPAVQQEITQWFEQNDWYRDPEMQAVANGLGAQVRQQYPDLVGAQFLDKVKERMQTLMPNRFSTRAAPRVEGGRPPAGRTRSNGRMTVDQAFAKLPQDAKDACLRFEKQGLMTRKQYISEYFGGEQ